MKKNLLLLICCLFGLTALQAQNPLVGVDHSVYTDDASLTDVWGYGVPTSYPAGHKTFRVYGYLDDANSVMQSVIGVPSGLEAYIGTDEPDGYLWNYPAPLGQTTGPAIPSGFIPFGGDGGTAMYDSYVTIGAENDDAIGGVTGQMGNINGVTFGIGESNVSSSVFWGSTPYSDALNPDFIMTNEAWLLGDVSGSNAFGVGPDFQVLLAQITTTADDIHYGLNLTALTDLPLSGGQTWITYWDPSGLGGTTFNEADGSALGLLYPADLDVEGCTDVEACNFNSLATIDDGSCTFPGCTDSTALNFDSTAGCDSGDCIFAQENDLCGNAFPLNCGGTVSGSTVNATFDDVGTCTTSNTTNGVWYFISSDNDALISLSTCSAGTNYDTKLSVFSGACDDLTCVTGNDDGDFCDANGSTLTSAVVFEATAGSTYYVLVHGWSSSVGDFDLTASCTDIVFGCTDVTACNFNSLATDDDGSCTFPGCNDSTACNYNPEAGCDDGSCDFGTCFGCTDSTACNFDSGATTDDGSCTYPGCDDIAACNYDSTAGCNDGSCDFGLYYIPLDVAASSTPVIQACELPDGYELADQPCIEELIFNDPFCINTDWDGLCVNQYEDCLGIVNGCTDSTACNFDSTATNDDGSCLIPVAGELSGEGETICAGDGIEDLIDVTVSGNVGDFQGWVVTDPDLNIIGLPDALPIDLEEAGPGNCWIWSISFYGELDGAELDANAADLVGCFALAGPYIVERLEAGCENPDASNYNPNAECPAECVFDGECTIVCPEDVTVECGTDTSAEALGFAFLEGECNETNGFVEIIDEISGDGCLTIIERTFTALDLSCTQTITVIDSTPPVFLADPEDVTVDCIEDVPAPIECPAEDACNSVTTEIFESNTGEILEICELTTAFGPGADWAIWLPALFDAGVAPSEYWLFDGVGTLETYNDGTAHVFGTIVNDIDNTLSFEVDYWFENGADWTAWSALGRNYKDDMGLATGGMLYEEWMYYEMVAGFSTLTGVGALEGSHLSFSHHPASYYFGFQCGEAANNKNANDGFSGWFQYSGFVDGVQITDGNGDINVDKECTPPPLLCPTDDEVTYLWRAEDDCGNASIVDQVITVHDDVAPTFINTPDDLALECDEWPIVDDYTIDAVDNCDLGDAEIIDLDGDDTNDILYLQVLISGDGDGCNDVYERLWRAVDVCGNETDFIQTITVNDTTDPVFTSVPADITIECDDEMPMDMAVATDNCSEPTVSMDDVSEGDSCESVVTRTFTAVDACGNETTAVQVITIVDTTAPVFDPYEIQLYVNCEDVVDVPALTATDNCNEFEITVEETFNSGGCMGVYHRLYTATDACGNTSTAEQFITVMDNEAPVINNPEDATVECDNVPATPGADGIDITDNCALEVDVTFEETITDGPCEDSYTITWVWTATDYCGNMSEATTVITVVDTTNPEWVEETLPMNVTIECDMELPEVVLPEATDNCDDDVLVEVSAETIEEGDCPYNYTVTRVFRGVDNCGNEVFYAQVITVQDTTPPTLEVAQNITIECTDDVPAAAWTADDNCGEVTVTVDEVEAGDSCESTITRTYTATDECGNMTMDTQVVTIVDTTAPSVMPAGDVTIECTDAIPAPEFTTEDNCNEVTVEVTEVSDGDSCETIIVRTYVPTDACGNVGEAMTQVITILDTTAPMVFPAADLELDCTEAIPAAAWTTEDNCNEVTVEVTEETTGDSCETIIVRTYVPTDACGNVGDAMTQTITITDTTAPIIVAAGDVTVECDQELPAPSWEASDDCSEYSVEVEAVIVNGDCPQEYVMTRTYTATDVCGNESTDTQVLTVVDTTAPMVFPAGDVTIECTDEIPAAAFTTEDNCGEVTVEITEVEAGDSCESTITRTYVPTDECGNVGEAMTQVITIVDTTAPMVFPAGDVTIDCTDEVPAPEFTTEDNCNEVTVEVSEVTDGDSCESVIVRTYTPTDACGNEGQPMTQVITIVDTTAPVFDAFDSPIDWPCDQLIDVTVTATDDCNEFEITIEDLVVSGNCADNVIRTYTATDICGNSSTATQIINLVDEVAPEFDSFPADVTVECDEFIPGQLEGEAEITFSDNCDDNVVLTYDGGVITQGDCPQNYVAVHTWTITDECDNSMSMSWTVTVQDTTAPELEVAGDVTIECTDDIPAAAWDADDNCGEVTVIVTEVEAGDSCESTITRTYTATDECDNVTVATQVVTIVDSTAPVVFVPGDYTQECDLPIEETVFTTEDNCNEVTVEVMEDVNDENPCEVIITRTFTPTDACGNVGETVTQTITIVDTTAPVFVDFAPTLTMSCDDIMNTTVDANDNCTDVTITFEDEFVSGACGGNIIRVYTATDECDNSVTATQIITLIDETAPEFDTFPADVTVECDEDIPGQLDGEAEVTFSDNCDDEVELIYEGSVTTEGDCPQNYSVAYTWTIVDDCENEMSMTWTVTVQDTTPPVLEVAGNVTIECTDEIPAPAFGADDNCGEVTVEITEVEAGDSCESTITRTYTAMDECGNMTVDTQVITILDTTAPSVMPAANVTIECTDDVPAPEFTTEDNCNEVTVEITEVTDGDSCESVIVRTYVPTDACGNVGQPMTQIITILDTTAPSVMPAASVTIECTDDVPAPEFTTEDNCNEVTVEISEVTTGDSCETIITRTYVPTDACGNVGEAMVQTITIVDTTAPTVEVPASVTIECTDEVPAADWVYSDNCNEGSVEVTEVTTGDSCETIITRTYVPTDICGNVGEAMVQTITIVDTTAPVVFIPGDVTIECTDDVPAANWDYSDNCNEGTVEVTEVETGDSCETIITRTYVPTDACGNVGEAMVQTITIVDTTAPMLTIANDVTINCDEAIPAPSSTVTDACNDASVEVTELIEGEDQCYSIIRTYIATDACGNQAEPQVQVITVIDDEAPMLMGTLEDITVQCADDVPSFDTWDVTDNCDPNPTVMTETELVSSDDCGNYVEIISCYAFDACGNQSDVVSFTVTVNDDTAPTLTPVEDLVLDCFDEVPDAGVVTAVDNCDDDIEVSYTEEIIGDEPNPDAIEDCNLEQATDACDTYEEDWALIFTDGYLEDNDQYKFYTLVEGSWLAFEDGTAQITATVVSTSNPEAGFFIDVMFENGMDYDMWISQEFPTGIKSDCFDDSPFEDWMYYIMSAGNATLEGWGDFAGSFIELSHLPSNYYFGYQVGVQANNQGGSYGSGGWFSYTGTFIDNSEDLAVEVDGAGDLSFKHDCCPDYTLVRTWCATDCSGNESCVTQTITFDGDGIPPVVEGDDSDIFANDDAVKGNFDIVAITPNPAMATTRVQFVSNSDDNLVLEVLDITGRVMGVLYNGQVEANVKYTNDYSVNALESGSYMIRLRSDNEQVVKQLIVSK